MRSKVLLRDIPAGKFHSALCTSYSINLYYLEQQILPLLHSKGVHYISLLVDGDMLSGELGGFAMMSEPRKRNYAIHGIPHKGAFHPKMIFLAGDSALLLLVGSGNLTSCGHGRNLESWNAIYVDDPEDGKLGLLLESWEFLKSLYSGLGRSGENIITSIESNCALLVASPAIPKDGKFSNADSNGEISFLATDGTTALIDKLIGRIGSQIINNIYIMSPFFDVKGQFIEQLQARLRPKSINVILQEHYGMPPFLMKPLAATRFFLWQDSITEKFKQRFFHAKHIILEGTETNMMYSGSANATLAAFGGNGFPSRNVEAGILYEGIDIDFPAMLGIRLANTVDLRDIAGSHMTRESGNKLHNYARITAVERELDEVTAYITIEKKLQGVVLVISTAKGTVALEQPVMPALGISKLTTQVNGAGLLYAELRHEGKRISNKQFIIDLTALEATNPSPQNRSLNQIKKLIEGGSFSSQKIIEYLNTLHQEQLVPSARQSGQADGVAREQKGYEENQVLMHLSYAQIQERIRDMEAFGSGIKYTSYKTVRLWDSIFSYLKEISERKEELAIDEEETEDLNHSSGRVTEAPKTQKKAISKTNFDRLKDKVGKFLDTYIYALQDNINNQQAIQPTLIDLSMYLIILEILLHLLSHKERVEGEDEAGESLLDIEFSDKFSSWSDYLIQIVGSFTLWCSRKGGVKIDGSKEYENKTQLYLEMALKTSVGAISIFSMVNRQYDRAKIEKWKVLNLKNSLLCFGQLVQIHTDENEFLLFIPEKVKEQLGEANLKNEIRKSLYLQQREDNEASLFEHPEDGMTYIEKFVPNIQHVKFYKLLHTGYDWDDGIKDYWNKHLFSPQSWRWIKAK